MGFIICCVAYYMNWWLRVTWAVAYLLHIERGKPAGGGVREAVKESELSQEQRVSKPDMLTLSESTKNDIVVRLRRIEGQARGVQRMVEEGRCCEDIIIQVAALKAAVTQAGVAIAGSHLVECVARSVSSGEGNCRDKLDGFARLFSKLA